MDLITAIFFLTATIIALSEDLHNLDDGRASMENSNTSRRDGSSCWSNCKVKGLSVDCSGRKCKSVPLEVDRSTTQLIMKGNDLGNISDTSFAHFPNLQYLDLSSCGIRLINAGTFDRLQQLQFLNLSVNPHLIGFPECIFCSLTSLTHLILTRTNQSITFRNSILRNLTRINTLWLGKNQLLTFPKFLDNQNNSLLPNIRELNLENNNIERIGQEDFFGLETLETLNLIGNRLTTIRRNAFRHIENFTKLELDRNYELCPHSGAFTSKSISFLSLSDTHTLGQFACSSIVFRGLTRLRVFNISRSKSLFRTIYPFYYFHRIEVLILRDVGLRNDMLERTARYNRRLRYLDISQNEISVLMSSSLARLKLEVLLVRDNWLSVIDLETLPQSTWTNLKRVDFSENTLNCDCKISWFRRWLQNRENSKVTVENLNLTQCTAPAKAKDKPVHLLVEPTDLECFKEEPGPYMVAVFLTAFFAYLIAPTVSMLHRLRWILKYWYFKHKTKAKEYRDILDDNKPYEFDAFISYSESDRNWVVSQLRPRLENEFGLRLCIHHRDWLVGRDIVDNVVDSIEHSRKTVLIVSNAFAVSQWCHFEMTMAQTKLFDDDRDNLILVLLEEIADCNMNPRLQLQMQKKTYIEWTGNQIGQQLFWAKLQQAVTKQSNSLINATPPLELFQ